VVLSARNFGDRVNPDAAKNVAAAAAEETALGLLLLYPEHRRAVCEGRIKLPAEYFFTDLGKRAFNCICEMERSESGFDFSAMGEFFTPDEMGRLVRLQQDRSALTNNTAQVLEAVAAVLEGEHRKRTANESGNWQSELLRRRAELKQKQEQ
jgi:hypothetical protein